MRHWADPSELTSDDVEFTQRWGEVRAHRIFIRHWASRKPTSPTVLMVHGIVSGRYLLRTARALTHEFGVVAPDLPGFGRSSRPGETLSIEEHADVLADVLAEAGVRKAIVLGHSIGAQVAASLAVRQPAVVDRLVLVGPTGDPEAASVPAVIGRWFANAPSEPVSFNALACRELVQVGVRRMVATLRAALADHFVPNVRRLQMPTIVVRGERDRVSPQRWAEEIDALLGHGHLVTISRFAHTVVYSAADELADVVGDFVRSGGVSEGPHSS